MKGKFFFNYTAQKKGDYDKYSYGVMTIECDDENNLTDEAFLEVKKLTKETYPNADNINITAFNRV